MGRSKNSITDILLNKENKKSPRVPDDEPDDMELTIEARGFMPLDTTPGLLERDREKMSGGINTRGSVFDRQALFRTNRGE